MKVFILKEGDIHYGDILNKNNQVLFSAWKPGNKIYPGTYALYIVNPKDLNLKLGEFEYSGKEDEWVTISNPKWVNVPENGIASFQLIIQSVTILKSPDYTAFDTYIYPENWSYKIFLKNNNESYDLENPTVEFCSLVGGVHCPFDPYTGIPMTQCLNWRRLDQVGVDCYKIMDLEKRKKSIQMFCEKNVDAADCKCVNRSSYPEYLKIKQIINDKDHCWYPPCKSGAYLLDKEGDNVECGDNKVCKILYNTDHVDENGSVTSCFKVKSNDSSKKIIIIVILLAVFILLKL